MIINLVFGYNITRYLNLESQALQTFLKTLQIDERSQTHILFFAKAKEKARQKIGDFLTLFDLLT